MLFKLRQPAFRALFSPVVRWWHYRAGLLVMRWAWRLGDEQILQMLEVTTDHVPLLATQVVNQLMKFTTSLFMCSCDSSSQMFYVQGSVNSSNVL